MTSFLLMVIHCRKGAGLSTGANSCENRAAAYSIIVPNMIALPEALTRNRLRQSANASRTGIWNGRGSIATNAVQAADRAGVSVREASTCASNACKIAMQTSRVALVTNSIGDTAMM